LLHSTEGSKNPSRNCFHLNRFNDKECQVFSAILPKNLRLKKTVNKTLATNPYNKKI
jgi:hypothetical protein